MMANDIERNTGPPGNSLNLMFSNINSISANEGKRFEDLSLADYDIEGYHALDHHLYNRTGRGMLLYLSESLIFNRCYDLDDKNIESMWVEIKVNHKSIIIGSFYRSPSQTLIIRDQFFPTTDIIIERALNADVDSVIVGGDFNSRSKLRWPEDKNSIEGTKLYDIMVKHSLSQHIHKPTRVTPTSKSCLDLLFTNTPGYIISAEAKTPVFGSDHRQIIASIDYKINDKSSSTHRVWKYDQTNTEALKPSNFEL
jgi:hypothetical protein